MLIHNPKPVGSAKNLRERVRGLFRTSVKGSSVTSQLALDLPAADIRSANFVSPSQCAATFLDFITAAMPDGDVYLFGGILRDLALLGRDGFNSDIDLVVEGNWSHFVSYLESIGAIKNKFGGYRASIGEWPIDIWNASETWAFKHGHVPYEGIASLTRTTVLNWDAILMNWRTKEFIYREKYFEELAERILDVVLEENPYPLGMAVRVFRHFSLKDARKITHKAARYMARSAKTYSYQELKDAELRSYNNSYIEEPLHRFFEQLDATEQKSIVSQFCIANSKVEKAGIKGQFLLI